MLCFKQYFDILFVSVCFSRPCFSASHHVCRKKLFVFIYEQHQQQTVLLETLLLNLTITEPSLGLCQNRKVSESEIQKSMFKYFGSKCTWNESTFRPLINSRRDTRPSLSESNILKRSMIRMPTVPRYRTTKEIGSSGFSARILED